VDREPTPKAESGDFVSAHAAFRERGEYKQPAIKEFALVRGARTLGRHRRIGALLRTRGKGKSGFSTTETARSCT
jgi:hypothetical protein